MNAYDTQDPGELLSREANALCGIFQFARERQYPETIIRQIETILEQRLLALAAETRAAQDSFADAKRSNAA